MEELKSGIYKLEWSNGHFYYGQTQNFVQRKSAHLSRLKKRTHTNIRITRLSDKYGLPKFSIIEYVELINLDKVEQIYLDTYISDRKCCNISIIAQNSRGVKRSEETKKKLSIARKGKKLSQEHKDSISKGLFKAYATGRVILPPRYGILNSYFGKHHPPEIRLKMKEKKSGMYFGGDNPRAKLVLNFETGIFYDCMLHAAKSISISASYMYNMLSGYSKNKTSFKLV